MSNSTRLLKRWSAAIVMALLAAAVACSGGGSPNKTPSTDAGEQPGEDAGPDNTPDAGTTDAGETSPDGGRTPGVGEPGSACTDDGNCQSLICLTSGVCSRACEAGEECPNTSWICGQDQGRAGVCVCAITEGGDDICDGEDNDCDGVVDDIETATCPGFRKCVDGNCKCLPENTCGLECVDKSANTRHCGECNNTCDRGAICDEGVCTCTGQSCGGACVDTTSDNLNCGGCANPCGIDLDCAASACIDADREWTRWPMGTGFLQGSNADEVFDYDAKLVWQKTHQPTPYTAEGAAEYCNALPHPDGSPWRLPTRAELLSIVDYDRAVSPTTAAAIAPGFVITPASVLPFWTATAAVGATPAKNWAVDFAFGGYNAYPVTAQFYVRCVRTDLN